jgi:CheY-like chemotaxis protein
MRRVLIVDDDAGNRALLTRLIRRDLDVDIAEAANGLDALDELMKQPCALMLLDMRMPVLDGLETLEIVRKSPGLKSLPVCFMTIDREEQLVQRAMALGVSDFILKPLNPDTVTARIRDILSGELDSAPPRRLDLEPRTRLIVVDQDDVFREFFVRHVAPRCNTTGCTSGVDALRACLRHVPDAIVISSNIGMLSRETLVTKLRALPTGMRTLCIAVVDGGSDATRPPDGCDAVLVRTLDQATFWADFTRVVNTANLTRPAA